MYMDMVVVYLCAATVTKCYLWLLTDLHLYTLFFFKPTKQFPSAEKEVNLLNC